MRKTTRLRELFYQPELLVLPGTCDALQGLMVQAAGFEACSMSGGGTSNMLGYPDAGFTTLTEMVNNASQIANAVEIPLLSDADTGYGNALNVRHSIRRFIQGGVAGVHLEDQVYPKRCGHVAGIEILPLDEAVGKLRAAVDAKRELDPDFVVVGRTDARNAVGGGLDEAIRRGQAFARDAGVDAVYLASPESREEMAAFAAGVHEVTPEMPVMGDTYSVDPPPSWEEFTALGYAVAFYPGAAFGVATVASWDYLHDFKARGPVVLAEFQARMRGHPLAHFGLNDLLGFRQLRELEQRYLPGDTGSKYEQSQGVYTP